MKTQLVYDDADQAAVRVSESGNVGILSLNKPSSLNALNLEMIQIIRQALVDWEEREDIKCIVLKGEGDRAFCAGGDIKATALAKQVEEATGQIKNEFAAHYFKEEYDLDLQLYKYPKPLVCMMKGITMGGGYGIAAPCDYRIAEENSIFAMPEVGIGLYPDVGAIYFLSRLANNVGTFLALTGTIINVADMLSCNFANHVVSRESMDLLVERLSNELSDVDGSDAINERIGSIIKNYELAIEDLKLQSAIDDHIEIINECFGSDTVQKIINDLECSGNDWAVDQAQIIRTKSPHSLILTHEYLKCYAKRSYEEVLAKDYEVSMYCMGYPDFYEGVRAQVIDKDKNPKWSPVQLDDVNIDSIADIFN